MEPIWLQLGCSSVEIIFGVIATWEVIGHLKTTHRNKHLKPPAYSKGFRHIRRKRKQWN